MDYIPHLVVLHVVKSQRRSLKEENWSILSSQTIQELVYAQQFHQYIYSEINLDWTGVISQWNPEEKL